MSDISQAAIQDDIASSIMDAPIVGSWQDESLAESAEPEPEAVEVADDQPTFDSLAESVAKPGESWQKEGAQRQAEAQPEQTPEQTPQEIQQGIEKLDALIEEHGLNDPVSAKTFSEDFCSAFGTTAYEAGVDTKALGSVMSKVAFSAVNAWEGAQGDPSKLAPVSPTAAAAFTRDFLRAWGVDSRAVEVNSQQLAQTVFAGALNFIDTYQRLGGKVQSLEQINSPEMAEYFLGSFLRSFGVEAQVDRTMALKFADAAGKYLLGFVGKLGQIQPQAASPRGRSQTSRPRASRMRTNHDIFSNDILDMVAGERMSRSRDVEEFAPKTARRQASSRFQSNRDIFSDDVMDVYQREHGRL